MLSLLFLLSSKYNTRQPEQQEQRYVVFVVPVVVQYNTRQPEQRAQYVSLSSLSVPISPYQQVGK